jgi:hypothetical protein
MEKVKGLCLLISEDKKLPCGGHPCVACHRIYYCGGEKHVCTPRPERTETGIERRQTFFERLAVGAAMLDWDNK